MQLEQYETFQKMSFRNRCLVRGAERVIMLSVPLVGGRDQKEKISAVRIENGQQWQKQHFRSIESCYNKSPFFLHYRESLEALLMKSYPTLWDLDLATIEWVLSKLRLKVGISFTEAFQKEAGPGCMDLRNRYSPANRNNFPVEPYQQVFDDAFEPNLCILDLLFNLGPAARMYLVNQTQQG